VKFLPNLMSGARLALAPYIFLLLWRRQYGLVLGLFLLVGVTDGLDGFLARKLNAYSRLGAYLDPIADKVLLSGSFLTLALDGAIAKWLAILVLGRDAVILLFAAGALLLSKSLREFPPSWWGKASTVAQISFIVALVGHLGGWVPEFLVIFGIWAVTVLLAVSSLDYAWRAVKMKK
jgi:cardiolipin synthase